MNPTSIRRHKEPRSRNEDHNASIRSRTEEKKQRREWERQQERRERQHERLKQQKILEYERRRAQALGYPEPKSSHHSRSKSAPLPNRHGGKSTISASKYGTLFEK